MSDTIPKRIADDAIYEVRLNRALKIPGTDVQLSPRHRHRIKGSVLKSLIKEDGNVRAAKRI